MYEYSRCTNCTENTIKRNKLIDTLFGKINILTGSVFKIVVQHAFLFVYMSFLITEVDLLRSASEK